MNLKGLKAHLRANRTMDRVAFTIMSICVFVAGVDAFKHGEDFWFWVYVCLGVLYAPMTLLAWFLPDEDLD